MPSAGELASSKLSPIRRPASTPWRRTGLQRTAGARLRRRVPRRRTRSRIVRFFHDVVAACPRGQSTPQIRERHGRLSRGNIWAYSFPKGSGRDAVDPMRTATGHQVPVPCVVPALTVRPARPGPGQPDRHADPESLPGAVISAIRRGQQLLRVVTGHLASSSVVAGHAAPIGSAWPPSAWHRGPCPCGHYALPGDAALNHAAYYRHVVAP